MEALNISSTKSFISAKVHQLICEIGSATVSQEEEEMLLKMCLDEDGYLQWGYLETVVFHGIDITADANKFEELVRRLAPVCQAVHSHVASLSMEEFKLRYYEQLQWTGMAEVFIESLEAVRSNVSVGNSVCLMLLTAALERSLGDIFLTRNSPCPSMLKDLLSTEELRDIFGCFVVFCLRVLIGPPTSLNLRNIVWHGFAAPQEISVRYSSFLLVLTASLGVIVGKKIPGGIVPHRQPLSFPQICELQHSLPDFTDTELDVISNLFSNSICIAKVMLPYWDAAVQYYREERYGICVVLLLTQLEQSLRQVFASANGCPHCVLTAESTILFTTFDEMMCPALPDDTDNLLVQRVGMSFMEMLLDLLEHQEGPRLRDHISHGEIDILNISKDIANYVLLVSSVLCVCVGPRKDVCSSKGSVILDKLMCLSTSYTSVFHPLSRLKSELTDYIARLTSWIDLSHPSHHALEHIPWCTYTEENFMTSSVYSSAHLMLAGSANEQNISELIRCLNAFSDVDSLQSFCKECKLQTLFRPRSELEVVALLRRIVRECRVVVTNVAKTATDRYQQWCEKNLRSRQRNNYARLLNK
ncbi:endoplasmic reticulum membrane-associated RNA degradation protein-like [Amphiura filiformis]|uniref:endoplasmic reticulum membrane-associated RNA degradation protein-like n=1 Tax=Amphiura filiformis TaxID=82378 RepID=UPI003B2244C0